MYLKRDVYDLMLDWRNDKLFGDKVLYLRGARQVGKTYLARKLGEEEFNCFIEINMSDVTGDVFYEEYIKNVRIHSLHDTNSGKCLRDTLIGMFPDFTDDTNTLIFIDEIQESKEVFNMIRHFSRKLNCKVVISGSYLGITVKEGFFLPAGDLYEITVDTLSFSEFLGCFAKDSLFNSTDLFGGSDKSNYQELHNYYKIYSYIGGYPSVILKFIETQNTAAAMSELKFIIDIFISESLRYLDTVHAKTTFNIILHGISIFIVTNKTGCADIVNNIRKNIQDTRTIKIHSKMISEVLSWLYNAGIIKYVNKYVDGNLLNVSYNQKVYFTDMGVINYFLRSGLNKESDISGILSENFVYREIVCSSSISNNILNNNYIGFATYTPTKGELDFLVLSPLDGKIYGIEVKSGNNTANTGNAMLKRGLLDYLYILKGDTLGGECDKIKTVPIYFASRLLFDDGSQTEHRKLQDLVDSMDIFIG